MAARRTPSRGATATEKSNEPQALPGGGVTAATKNDEAPELPNGMQLVDVDMPVTTGRNTYPFNILVPNGKALFIPFDGERWDDCATMHKSIRATAYAYGRRREPREQFTTAPAADDSGVFVKRVV